MQRKLWCFMRKKVRNFENGHQILLNSHIIIELRSIYLSFTESIRVYCIFCTTMVFIDSGPSTSHERAANISVVTFFVCYKEIKKIHNQRLSV